MAYTAWTVVYGEQPSVAKWNILGTNDASFNDGTGIANGVITSEHLNATIACRAYRSAAFSVVGGGGEEKLTLDAESYDLGSNWDTTNGRFTAPLTGYYQVNAHLALDNVDDGGQALVYIYVNGAAWAIGSMYSAAATADPRASVSDVVSITAGQYIEFYMDCSTSESGNPGATDTFMSIFFIGA